MSTKEERQKAMHKAYEDHLQVLAKAYPMITMTLLLSDAIPDVGTVIFLLGEPDSSARASFLVLIAEADKRFIEYKSAEKYREAMLKD